MYVNKGIKLLFDICNLFLHIFFRLKLADRH